MDPLEQILVVKKKPMTEKQALLFVTRRRNCIQKWRDSLTKKRLPKVPKEKVVKVVKEKEPKETA